MKKHIEHFKLWLFGYLFKSLKDKLQSGAFVKVLSKSELYRFCKSLIRKERPFVTHVKQINVKKGKRKYTLLILNTLKGEIKVNLGRHREIINDEILGYFET